MPRTAPGLLLAALLLVATAAPALSQVLSQRYDPSTGNTATIYRNADGSTTVEVVDRAGNVIFRRIKPISGALRNNPYYYGSGYGYGGSGYGGGNYYYGNRYGSYGSYGYGRTPAGGTPNRSADSFGVPLPSDPGRVVRNPNNGGTLQTHPNPNGTRTVVEVDRFGNVRTYVVEGNR